MNTKFLGSLLLLAGLTASNIEAKSKLSDYEFENKTQSSLIFKSKSLSSARIKKGEIFHADTSGDENFKEFTVSTKDNSNTLTIRPSKKDSHTIITSDDTTAHSVFNKFDIYMNKDGSLRVNGTGFFNPFKN